MKGRETESSLPSTNSLPRCSPEQGHSKAWGWSSIRDSPLWVVGTPTLSPHPPDPSECQNKRSWNSSHRSAHPSDSAGEAVKNSAASIDLLWGRISPWSVILFDSSLPTAELQNRRSQSSPTLLLFYQPC